MTILPGLLHRVVTAEKTVVQRHSSFSTIIALISIFRSVCFAVLFANNYLELVSDYHMMMVKNIERDDIRRVGKDFILIRKKI